MVTQAPAEESQDVQPVKRKPTAAELGPKEFCWGTGRRKSSVARVRIRPGSGKFLINKREFDNYFPGLRDQNDIQRPLSATDSLGKYDIWVNVIGGGTTGQAGAVLLGLARALIVADPSSFQNLRDGGFLTRDSRAVERKKYGKRGARRSFQFSKR
ncbi:MAG: 30S ribosomal protein S9 [Phycisphaerae bacterium]|nr:30S ribosomal protein S9 [Phycisphaerae bacterium]